MGPRSNLALRVLSACVFVPAVLALSWMGGLALLALVLGVVGRGAWEFYHLAGGQAIGLWPGWASSCPLV